MPTRRQMLKAGAAIAGGGAALHWGARAAGAEGAGGAHPAGLPGKDYRPVIAPGGKTLPWKIVDGAKVYHLVIEEFDHAFCPPQPGLPGGLRARCWGFNGMVNGPLLEAVEGDRVRVYVTNKLPARTSVHWHGAFLLCGMDGVAGLTQRAIAPGETFKYEWVWRQHGTFAFHSHCDEMTQMALGMTGMIAVHPRRPDGPPPDRDFALMLHEWRIPVGARRPDPNEMAEFNVLTINGKCFPGTAPLVAQKGDRVRIRLANFGAMDHHPFHVHGHRFRVAETDGGQIPPSAQQLETTVLVAVGQTRAIEFIADAPGDWAMHCHMTHHVMNQMGHGLPNMIGAKTDGLDANVASLLPDYMTMGNVGMGDMAGHVHMGHMKVPANSLPMIGLKGPFDYIDMGGMLTVLKIRESLPKAYREEPAWNEDPGWYDHPRGTVAGPASPEEMRRDLGAQA